MDDQLEESIKSLVQRKREQGIDERDIQEMVAYRRANYHRRQKRHRRYLDDGTPVGCSVDGCGIMVMARGMCSAHYSAWYRVNIRGVCLVESCQTTADRWGYCLAHYKRLLKYGDPEATPVRPWSRDPQPCFLDRCDRRATRKGLCTYHYNKALREEKEECSRQQH